jgi:hypothetical protein
MLSEREREIKNVLVDQLAGSARAAGQKRLTRYLDPDFVRLAVTRMAVNKRRMVIFSALYFCVVLTAVVVMTQTVSDYKVLLWVVVGSFNAVNAAIHYAEYNKKKLVFTLIDILETREK